MLSDYEDIVSRINERPLWWDEHGVPRYDKFTPELCPDIYADEVVLLMIACQYCSKKFKVELHGGVFNHIKHPHKLHYGDPPRHGCVGDTMNCEDLAVLEVWHHPSAMNKWERKSELEGVIDET